MTLAGATEPYHKMLRQQVITGLKPLDAADHDELLRADRRLYAALLALGHLHYEDALSIIRRLLAITDDQDKPVSFSLKRKEDQLIGRKLGSLPYKKVLESWDALRELKVNNRRTSTCIRSYILGSPDLEKWAANHRRQLARNLQHALGKHRAQNICHFLLREKGLEPHQKQYLEKELYRFGTDRKVIREVFLFLFGKLKNPSLTSLKEYLNISKVLPEKTTLNIKTLKGLASTYHKQAKLGHLYKASRKEKIKRESTLELEEDHSLIGKLRQALKSRNMGLHGEAFGLIEEQAKMAPSWDIHLEIILDTSRSMEGYGHRVFNSLAIGLGLTRFMELKVQKTGIQYTGPVENGLPVAGGATNLAPALLEAMRRKPDAVLLISDGYENLQQGDTADVLEALRSIGVHTPIVQILPAFTRRENLEDRQLLGEAFPCLVETGENGFGPLYLQLQLLLEQDRLEAHLASLIEHPELSGLHV